MSSRTRLATGGLITVVLAASLAACSSRGDLSIWNDGPTEVKVSTGDDETTVSATGGVVLLDYGCTPGDVTVTFPSGRVAVVPGPVCPEQEIVISDSEVGLRPSSGHDT